MKVRSGVEWSGVDERKLKGVREECGRFWRESVQWRGLEKS